MTSSVRVIGFSWKSCGIATGKPLVETGNHKNSASLIVGRRRQEYDLFDFLECWPNGIHSTVLTVLILLITTDNYILMTPYGSCLYCPTAKTRRHLLGKLWNHQIFFGETNVWPLRIVVRIGKKTARGLVTSITTGRLGSCPIKDRVEELRIATKHRYPCIQLEPRHLLHNRRRTGCRHLELESMSPAIVVETWDEGRHK